MSVKVSQQAGDALGQVDPIWFNIRREAEEIVAGDPAMASFVFATVLNHRRLEDAVVNRVAQRLEFERHGRRRHPLRLRRCARRQPGTRRDHALRHRRGLRPRSGLRAPHRAAALLQGLPRHPDPPSGALAVERGAARLRALSAEPLLGGLPDRHQSGRADGPRASSSTTPPASSSARPRSSRTTCRSCRA